MKNGLIANNTNPRQLKDDAHKALQNHCISLEAGAIYVRVTSGPWWPACLIRFMEISRPYRKLNVFSFFFIMPFDTFLIYVMKQSITVFHLRFLAASPKGVGLWHRTHGSKKVVITL